jgi:nuclear pore complex protein Nup205
MHRSSKLESGKAKSAKRKITATPGPDESPQQRTIADLFSNSKNHSSPNKRLKRDPSDPAIASPLPPDKMYSFTSSRPNGTIDLTTSPTKSFPRSNSISGKPSNFAPNQGSKKLVVKNLRTTPKGNADQYLSKVLGQLDEALTEIFKDEQPTQSLEELYKGTENLCRQGRASDINKKLVERCKIHISTTLKNRLLEKAAVGKPVDTLRAVVDAWLNWNRQLVCENQGALSGRLTGFRRC